jgi:hypothetical protein
MLHSDWRAWYWRAIAERRLGPGAVLINYVQQQAAAEETRAAIS